MILLEGRLDGSGHTKHRKAVFLWLWLQARLISTRTRSFILDAALLARLAEDDLLHDFKLGVFPQDLSISIGFRFPCHLERELVRVLVRSLRVERCLMSVRLSTQNGGHLPALILTLRYRFFFLSRVLGLVEVGKTVYQYGDSKEDCQHKACVDLSVRDPLFIVKDNVHRLFIVLFAGNANPPSNS